MRIELCLFSAVLLLPLVLFAQSVRAADGTSLARPDDDFALDLYARLRPRDGNLFFSPTSIQSALAMTSAGAAGQTAREMAQVLHLDPQAHEKLGMFLGQLNEDGKKGSYELAVSNALWAAKGYPITPAFLSRLQKEYDAHLIPLDFAANPQGSRKTINDSVAADTHDRIKDLVPADAINTGTRLVLTNAIYFKGRWDQPFNKKLTSDDDFTVAGDAKVKAPFMFQRSHFRHAQDDDVQVLELTYGKNALALRIFLPKKTDGLAALEPAMTTERVAGLVAKLQFQDVEVWLPMFTIESEFSLSETLKAMGMKLAFDPDAADFSGISSSEKLFISAVIHKAFVKLDEEGTEAAAATAVVMSPGAARVESPPVQFRANHPFLFQIVHQPTGAVLFMGRLATP